MLHVSSCCPHVSNNLALRPLCAVQEPLDQPLGAAPHWDSEDVSHLTTPAVHASYPPASHLSFSCLAMYLENKSNLEIEMSQTSAQSHQGRNSLRSPEADAGNFGELRLLQDISESRDTQKLPQSAGLPAGQCVIHAEGFVPVRQEDGYARLGSQAALTSC